MSGFRSTDRPLIMGILNATPDSFSDGGQYDVTERALAHIRRMVAEGADLIDVGGESTRPGAQPVGEDEQLRRTLDIVAECRRQIPKCVDISIDTTRSKVAEQALNAGATLINDVTAGVDDPAILELAAARKAPICLMHMQGRPATMQDNPRYQDVAAEVRAHLLRRAEAAIAAGVEAERIVIDPGIGFGKTAEHNLQLLAALPDLANAGFPVLLGTSRKGFLAPYARSESGPPAARLLPTCATTALGVASGVRIFRVHDVRENREAADTAWAVVRHRLPGLAESGATEG